MKKLQVLLNGNWEYVFCHNPVEGIITTKKKHLALKERDLTYFENRFGNNSFRTIQ